MNTAMGFHNPIRNVFLYHDFDFQNVLDILKGTYVLPVLELSQSSNKNAP